MVFWLQNIISLVVFSSPALRPLALQRRTAHLPLGAALHDLQEEVDCLQTLVASLTARYPHLPFPDFGQREVRNYPFLRQHLLQNFKPWGEKKIQTAVTSVGTYSVHTLSFLHALSIALASKKYRAKIQKKNIVPEYILTSQVFSGAKNLERILSEIKVFPK